jgi:hypothetical protein
MLICCLLPVAAGTPLLMRHLLRTWIVDSWNHIAARRMCGRLANVARRINKPLFVALRLLGFPLTWLQYYTERAALPELVRASAAPLALHAPLSCAHLLMYGLMCWWGRGLLLAPSPPKEAQWRREIKERPRDSTS